MDVAAYLERIGYRGTLEPTVATLRGLHRAHMLAVPFENLDIHGARRHISLDADALFAKVVGQRRGGFCYELNGLFGALLRTLGFDVQLLSGRVLSGTREGPEFDHLLLLVTIDGERWVADVGFGDSSLEPLRLEDEGPQGCPMGAWKLTREGTTWAMWGLGPNGQWVERYRFSLTPHSLAEFAEMCEYHQTSPESPFTRNRLCSLPTANGKGRVTLSGNRLTVVTSGHRTIQRVDETAFAAALHEHFGFPES